MRRLWLKTLRRRSQKANLSWERFIRVVDPFFPPIKTLHPLPCRRFDAKTRGRRSARGFLAGACAGRGRRAILVPTATIPETGHHSGEFAPRRVF